MSRFENEMKQRDFVLDSKRQRRRERVQQLADGNRRRPRVNLNNILDVLRQACQTQITLRAGKAIKSVNGAPKVL